MDYDFYNPYLLNKLDTIDAEELMATPMLRKTLSWQICSPRD